MTVLSLALPPVFGFIIGFATNALAIRMLFRPYQEKGVPGLRFQGMIPRRKADIARTVSRTVVQELLREERVAQRLSGGDVRAAFEALLLELAERYLGREYGSLAEWVGEDRRGQLEAAIGQAVLEVGQAAQQWLRTPEGVRVAVGAVDALLDRSAGELLRGEEALASRVAVGKALEVLASPDLEARVREVLAGLLVRLAGTEKPLRSYLPEEVRQVFFRSVGAAVPTLLRRFEQALLSPENVLKIKGAVRSGIEAYLLETEGGLVKNLVRQAALLGRERIFREADDLVDANLYRLGELVYEEGNRARMEGAIEGALDALLERTPGQVLAGLPAESLDLLYGRAAAWICQYLGRPEVAEAVAHLVEREFDRLFETPLRDLLEASGLEAGAAERWGRNLARWAAEGGLASVAEREAPLVARSLVGAPLGRPSRFLPPGLLREVAGLALDHLMPLLASKVPEVLRIVDVRGLIERQILEFSPAEVERVILSVARRELRAITWWGGVLGAAVGSLQTLTVLLG